MPDTGAGGESTDEQLFSRVAGGDGEAFASFYDRHASRWFGLALRILGDAAEAEDVLQEAALLIWERAPLFDPGQGRPASWAIAVVRHKAIDRLRAGRRRSGLLERLAVEGEEPPATPEAAPVRLEADAASLIRRTLLRLPPDQRRAIELAFFGGLSQSEIASQLGHPLGTVKARIRRGMLALREALEGAL